MFYDEWLKIMAEKPIRCLYEIECFNPDSMLIFRRFASTKRKALSIIKNSAPYNCTLRKLRKSEWKWVNPALIEREER